MWDIIFASLKRNQEALATLNNGLSDWQAIPFPAPIINSVTRMETPAASVIIIEAAMHQVEDTDVSCATQTVREVNETQKKSLYTREWRPSGEKLFWAHT